MAGNAANILGTVAAGGNGTDLAWFAPFGTAAPLAVAFTAEVQTNTITGTATAITATWNGLSTPSQSGTVTTAALTTAVNLAWASRLGGGSVTVTGTAGSSYIFTFPAALGNVSAVSLTTPGATNATVETTPGAGANPASAAIPASYKSGGICDVSGLDIKYADTTAEIDGFGLSSAARILFTKQLVTFGVTFEETNHTTQEIYYRLAIGSTATADGLGYIPGVTVGAPNLISYAAIFDIIDGLNHLRYYCPNVQNTARTDQALTYGAGVKYGVTLTAFPDSTNTSVYVYPIVGALAGL